MIWLVKHGRNEEGVRKAFIIVDLTIGCLIVPAGFVGDKITAVWLLTISLGEGCSYCASKIRSGPPAL